MVSGGIEELGLNWS